MDKIAHHCNLLINISYKRSGILLFTTIPDTTTFAVPFEIHFIAVLSKFSTHSSTLLVFLLFEGSLTPTCMIAVLHIPSWREGST